MNSISKYHSFEFVSINYISGCGVLLEPKLFEAVGDSSISQEMGLGKHGDGILEPG